MREVIEGPSSFSSRDRLVRDDCDKNSRIDLDDCTTILFRCHFTFIRDVTGCDQVLQWAPVTRTLAS